MVKVVFDTAVTLPSDSHFLRVMMRLHDRIIKTPMRRYLGMLLLSRIEVTLAVAFFAVHAHGTICRPKKFPRSTFLFFTPDL